MFCRLNQCLNYSELKPNWKFSVSVRMYVFLILSKSSIFGQSETDELPWVDYFDPFRFLILAKFGKK